jgi:hypothetical protein
MCNGDSDKQIKATSIPAKKNKIDRMARHCDVKVAEALKKQEK